MKIKYNQISAKLLGSASLPDSHAKQEDRYASALETIPFAVSWPLPFSPKPNYRVSSFSDPK